MAIVYLSLGSNLGDRERNLRCALKALDGIDMRVLRVSHLYESTPIGETPEPVPEYLNCVAEAETSLPPIALLDYTQAAERECGRAPTYRWGPRAIDIDIVWYEGIEMITDRLTIPHMHSQSRAFVLIPLAELAPDLKIGNGEMVRELLIQDSVRAQSVRRLPDSVLFR